MCALDIVMKKREGVSFLISGYVDGSIPAYQTAAFRIAVSFQGMTPAETGFMTREMIASGKTIDLSAL